VDEMALGYVQLTGFINSGTDLFKVCY